MRAAAAFAVLPLLLASGPAAARNDEEAPDPRSTPGRAIALPAVPAPVARPGFRVYIRRPDVAAAVHAALEGAASRLERTGCSDIFTDFADVNGRSLQSRLDEMGFTAAAYLGQLGFRDGHGLDRCHSSHILALTAPGSGIVWICEAFTPTMRRDPGLAEVVVLHEALHSLGLPENPPSSLEVTHEIVKRCGR